MLQLRFPPLFVLSALAIAGCGSPKQPSATEPSAAQAPASAEAPATPTPSPLDGAALIVDVRTPEEHESGHLTGDVLIPVTELEGRLDEVAAAVGGDRTKRVVVYCRSGGRAGRAKALLEANGFSNVVNAGGYDALK